MAEDPFEMEFQPKRFIKPKSDFNSRAEWASTTVCISDESELEEEDEECESQIGKKTDQSGTTNKTDMKAGSELTTENNSNQANEVPGETNILEVSKEETEREKQTRRLLLAAQKNEVDVVREMLEKDPSLVNTSDSDLYTPLHRACYSNNVEVIKVLLSYDADVSAKTCDGREPLHCACQWDCVEAASLMLQNGANVNALTTGKLTPLHLASANSKARRTLELLLWHPYVDNTVISEANDLAYDTAYRSSPYATLYEILDESLNVY